MADPNMEEQARAAEEYERRNRNRGNTGRTSANGNDEDDENKKKATQNFSNEAERHNAWRDAVRNRDELMNKINEILDKRAAAAEDVDRYRALADDAYDRFEQTWVSPDGREYSMSYDEYLYILSNGVSAEDQKARFAHVSQMLDAYPNSISAASKAGFSFLTADDFDIAHPNVVTETADEKSRQFEFLDRCIKTYNKGEWEPYFDRSQAHNLMKADPGNTDTPFSALKKSSEFPYGNEDYEAIAKEYGVDAKTIEKWYAQADRVFLAHERDSVIDKRFNPEHGFPPFNVEYTDILGVSAACAYMQAGMNQDGVYVDNIFDTIHKSVDAHYEFYDATVNMEQSAKSVDEYTKNLKEYEPEIAKARENAKKQYAKVGGTASGLKYMYDEEMNRFHNGYTQQPPRMCDMVNRWARGKTRFLDSRREAKEQMREQKWAAKTGINERGIKTNGSLADWFKSIFNEVRRGIAVSGVLDVSAAGDANRVLLAVGIDACQNNIDRLRNALDNVEDKWFDRKLKKRLARATGSKSSGKGMDAANYTTAIQIASEAETGRSFNGDELAVRDYDGRDNNPADVMAGWDKHNEKRIQNLQLLADSKGYHTDDGDDLDTDGPDISDEPELD